jgi:hypothetical protein
LGAANGDVGPQDHGAPEAIIGLVAAGTGVSMLPKGSHSLPREGVCTVPIQGEESVVVMAWREDRRTPVARAYLHMWRLCVSAQVLAANPVDSIRFHSSIITAYAETPP